MKRLLFLLFLPLAGMAQTNTNLNNVAIGGNLTAVAGQNSLVAFKFGAVLHVDGIKYTTIAAALAACPSGGCEVIDDSAAGTVTVSVNPFAGITTPFQVFLACGVTYQTTAQWQLSNSSQQVIGCGQNSTTIAAVAGFPYNTSGGAGCLMRIGTGAAHVHDTRLERVNLNPLQTDANSCGLYSNSLDEQSGIILSSISGFREYGIHLQNGGTIAQNFVLWSLEITGASGATSGIFFDGSGGRSAASDITVGMNSGTGTNGIECSNAQCILSSIHIENYTDSIKFDPGAFGAINGVNGSLGTNALHLAKKSDGTFTNITAQATITNTVQDDRNSVTLTQANDANIPLYAIDHGATQDKPYWIDHNGLHIGGGFQLSNLLLSATAPSISPSSGFNTGTIDPTPNGTATFIVTVGSGTANSTGTISLPTAAHGWNCSGQNQNRADVIQQSANTATSATLTNFGTTFAATNWTNGDVLVVQCQAR